MYITSIPVLSQMLHVLDGFDDTCFDIEDHFEFLVPYEGDIIFNFRYIFDLEIVLAHISILHRKISIRKFIFAFCSFHNEFIIQVIEKKLL